jgi:two-component system NtrC family sensor kinase
MKLGTRLVVWLIATVVITMAIHGYLSIQQDEANVAREIRVGMRGFTRSVQAALQERYADHQNFNGIQPFLDAVGPKNNIHNILVYNANGEIIARSASILDASAFPDLDPTPLMKLDVRPALSGKTGGEGDIHEGQTWIHYRIEPIFAFKGKVVGAFVLARHGTRLTQSVAERRDRILSTTTALVILLSVLILITVRRNVSRPISELIQRIREIGHGRWEQRIRISGQDEIALLAREFNIMSEELERTYAKFVKEQGEKIKLERDLRHSERLASVGQLAAGLAHELGTPLNIIGGRAEYLLRRDRSPDEIKGNLEVIRSQSDRIASIVRRLLEFARRKEPNLRPVDMPGFLKNIHHTLEHQLQAKHIQVEFKMPPSLPTVHADPDLLQQVFFNLYSNALHALGDGGRIRIAVEMAGEGNHLGLGENGVRWMRVIFEDNGAGIAPEHLNRVFDPFFTTKDIGEGTGLGLSVIYGIIKDHGGEIRVESEESRFTRFIIDLPMEPFIASAPTLGLSS